MFCNLRIALLLMSGVVLAATGGCQKDAPSKKPAAGSETKGAAVPSGRNERGDVLFQTVVQQLRDLPSYVDVELTPPTVVLDSKSSSDGQDVMTICTMTPGTDDGPINCLTATTHNGRFRSLGVRPGDIIKYYVLYDEDSAETGISQTVSMDLTVAQVLDENRLLVEGGINQPVLEPAKIEIWRYSDERLSDIARAIATYERYRLPVFDWEPSPDNRVLKQMTERLNQWMRQSQPKTKWSLDPLTSTIDPEIAKDERLAPLITADALADAAIQPHEGRLLQEAVWLRDVGRWTQGDSFDDLARATALFDWVIRNIQLDADGADLPYRPWESLVFGHGTAEQRAWVFALMARQLGLDVVVLEVPEEVEDNAKTEFWLPALLSNGKLYLFDTRLGLPVPGKDSQGVATLAELKADPALLRQLDLEDSKYPVAAEQLDHVTAHVVADPFDLSRRAAAIQSKLSGDDRLAVTVSPTAIAEKLKTMPEITGVALWDFPFAVIRDQLRAPNTASQPTRREMAIEFQKFAWRPTLWKARVLQFQGHEKGDIDSLSADLDEVVNDHRDAIGLYTSSQVRPPDRVLNSLGSEPKKQIYAAAKDAASYWVGLLLFDEGNFGSAEDWLSDPRLVGRKDGQWSAGTRYNLGRTLEAQGELAKAIEVYEADTSPQRDGNRLRARQLKNKLQSTPQAGDDSKN